MNVCIDEHFEHKLLTGCTKFQFNNKLIYVRVLVNEEIYKI